MESQRHRPHPWPVRTGRDGEGEISRQRSAARHEKTVVVRLRRITGAVSGGISGFSVRSRSCAPAARRVAVHPPHQPAETVARQSLPFTLLVGLLAFLYLLHGLINQLH